MDLMLVSPVSARLFRRGGRAHAAKAAMIALVVTLVAPACGRDVPLAKCVALVDQTSVALTDGWTEEAMTTVGGWVDDNWGRCGTLAVGGIGHFLRDATLGHPIDLHDCKGRACDDAATEAALIARALAKQLLDQPIQDRRDLGTDILSAVRNAVAHMGEDGGSLMILSDGLDAKTFSTDPSASLLPNLKGIDVTMSGVGAGAESPWAAERALAWWTELLDLVGADRVRIGRSV